MYYLKNESVWYFIKHKEDEQVYIGPFDSNSDAFLVAELLNTGKMRLELGTDGKESA